MTVHAWRITKAKHAKTAFTGFGAKEYGGRWNSPGTSMVYTASSTSLAILEMLVHLQVQDLIHQYVVFEITFNETLVETLPPRSLPKNWSKSPAPETVKILGDAWVKNGTSAVLQVPSVVVPSEVNYLLNPAHPAFASITIGRKKPLTLDPRLFKGATSPGK